MSLTSRIAAVVLAAINCCFADAIDDNFASGAVDLTWGMNLDDVIAVTPPGDNVFSTAPGQRSYWVKDGRDFLGVPRSDQGVLYSFDENDRLSSITVSYAYERKDQLVGVLLAMFSQPLDVRAVGTRQLQSWRSSKRVGVTLTTSLRPKHGIVWLTLTSPRLTSKPPSPQCSCEQSRDSPTR